MVCCAVLPCLCRSCGRSLTGSRPQQQQSAQHAQSSTAASSSNTAGSGCPAKRRHAVGRCGAVAAVVVSHIKTNPQGPAARDWIVAVQSFSGLNTFLGWGHLLLCCAVLLPLLRMPLGRAAAAAAVQRVSRHSICVCCLACFHQFRAGVCCWFCAGCHSGG